jgi:hypothetical protein
MYIYDVCLSVLPWEMFQRLEKIKTHFTFNNIFFSENRAVYEIMWKNTVQTRQATGDNIIRRMRFACWITKATDIHTQYVILISFPRQQSLRERALMLRYIYIACLVFRSPPDIAAQFFTLRHDCLLSHPFQFAIHRSSYHSQLLICKERLCLCRRTYISNPFATSALEYGGWLTPPPCRLTTVKRPITSCTGGWMIFGARLDGHGNSRSHWDSIPGLCNP